MKKPASYKDLPNIILEHICHSVYELDYDSYESSTEECIAQILNGNISGRNHEILENFYDNLSADDLMLYIDNNLNSIEHTKKQLIDFKNSLL